MNVKHDGINTDLRAHPDMFIPRDGIYEDNDTSNYNIIDDTEPRTRSNSGSFFDSTSSNLREQQPTMLLSQSYGGDRSSFLLSRQGGLSPVSRLYRSV